MTDILEYILPNQLWQIGAHFEGPHPIYTVVVGNQIWNLKGKQGFPWDMNTFDDQFIYQSITENIFTNPKTFKMFASQSWANGNGGIVWAPRQIPTIPSLPIATMDSSFRVYTDCSTFTTKNLGGPVSTWLQGPMTKNFGGDLGQQDSIMLQYFWGTTMEVFWYVRARGLVQWESHSMPSGTITNISIFNKLVQGGPPLPNFPCAIPTI